MKQVSMSFQVTFDADDDATEVDLAKRFSAMLHNQAELFDANPAHVTKGSGVHTFEISNQSGFRMRGVVTYQTAQEPDPEGVAHVQRDNRERHPVNEPTARKYDPWSTRARVWW